MKAYLMAATACLMTAQGALAEQWRPAGQKDESLDFRTLETQEGTVILYPKVGVPFALETADGTKECFGNAAKLVCVKGKHIVDQHDRHAIEAEQGEKIQRLFYPGA